VTEQEQKSNKAANRTDLAEDRTIMAVERTFAGWMRTSFAAIGIGIAFQALFGQMEPAWLARGIASMFMLLAAVFAISAERRACKSLHRMNSHEVDSPDRPHLKWISYAVAAGAVILAIAIWWVRGPEEKEASEAAREQPAEQAPAAKQEPAPKMEMLEGSRQGS
jgi:putative membrane protein